MTTAVARHCCCSEYYGPGNHPTDCPTIGDSEALADLLVDDLIPPNGERRKKAKAMLAAAIEAAARAEREACAQLAASFNAAGGPIAEAIRKRGGP